MTTEHTTGRITTHALVDGETLIHEHLPRLLRWWTADRSIDVCLMVIPQPTDGHTCHTRIGRDIRKWRSTIEARKYVRRYFAEMHAIKA